MEKAIKLEIPNKVDYESGPNWGSIKQEETMEKVKQLWALAQANPKISIAVVVVVIAIYFLLIYIVHHEFEYEEVYLFYKD